MESFKFIFSAYTILFVLFLCHADPVTGQQSLPALDFNQFRNDIESIQSPEEKLSRYVEMSLDVVQYNPDSLFTYAEEIKNLPGLEPSKQEAFQLLILANAWRAFDRDSSIYYGLNAADRLKEVEAHEEYLRTLNLLGVEYVRKSSYLEAEAAFLNGISYSESVDSVEYPFHYFYGNLGNLYSSVGAYDLAVKMFESFMKYEDNPPSRCNILSRLSKSLMEMEELVKAENMLAPCLNYPDLPPHIQAIVRSNLSEITARSGQKEYSLQLMEEAAFISEKYRVPNLHIAHLIRLGNQYLDMERVEQADSIRSIMETTPFRGLNHHFSIERALFLADLSLAEDQYETALAYADSAIEIAQTVEMEQFLNQVYETKATAREKMGQLDLAVSNLRLQQELEELQDSRKKEKDLAMMKVRYQLQNSEDRLAMIHNQLTEMNRRYLLFISLTLILILATGFVYSRYRKSKKKVYHTVTELQNKEVTIQELEQKLKKQNRKLKEKKIPEWIALNSKVRLSLDEIKYILSEGNYVKICLADPDRKPLMQRMTLKECEELLPDEIYMRIHRSAIVNLRHVSHVQNDMLFLKDDTELKISRRYRKKIMVLLN